MTYREHKGQRANKGLRAKGRGLVPLNRALSKLGVLSRSEATQAILDGRVRVDGRIVRTPTLLVKPEHARIDVDRHAASERPWRTILLYKPRGVMTTRRDPQGRPTVYDLLGPVGEGLVAVGRLDFATSGVLLLTTDTELANWLTDPENGIPRLYVVTVKGYVSPETVLALDGKVTLRKASGRESHLLVELREGRNRQVRKMFADAGHDVRMLKRVKFGPLELGTLSPGTHKEIPRNEIANAFPEAPLRAI